MIAFTKESTGQKRKTNYALSSQQKEIRKRINDIITREVAKSNATKLLELFTNDVIEKKITKEVFPIYPVKNVRVRKIKVIQRPKVDSVKLAEMHENEKRILTKDEHKKTLKGDRRKKEEAPQAAESTNLLSREAWLCDYYLWIPIYILSADIIQYILLGLAITKLLIVQIIDK